MAELWNLSRLAVELDKDRRTLERLLDGLTPDEETTDGAGRTHRKWKLARVFPHLSGSTGQLDANHERARKDKEMADKLALENAVRRGELGVIVEVAEWYAQHVDRCASRLEQIPDALGQLIDSKSAAVVIPECRRLINEAREELAADSTAGGPVGAGTVDASADADSQRMGGREPAAKQRKQRGTGVVAN